MLVSIASSVCKGLLSLRVLDRTNRTYVEDVEDPDKILFPTHNLLLVPLRKHESDYCAPFTLLDDLPLDSRHGSAIQPLVSGSLTMFMIDMAHAFSSSIASRIDRLSPSNRLPFNLR
jgi:hypothetical protein